DDTTVTALMGNREMNPFTTKSIITIKDLLANLQVIRDRGWAFDDEERYIGMRCIAAPVFNEFGEAVAGLSISGPAGRLHDERAATVAAGVMAAANDVTRKSGGMAPANWRGGNASMDRNGRRPGQA